MKDAQVGVLRRRLREGKTREASVAAAGMSVGSARKWQHGAYPSQRRKPHTWRTRPDPFAEIFESEVVPLLAADEKRVLEARTILGELDRRHPDGFPAPQLRTLQRRIRQWRALNGAGQGGVLSPGTSARTRSGLRLHQLRRTRRDDRWRTVRASALRVGVELQWLALADGSVERKLRSAAARGTGSALAAGRCGGSVALRQSVGSDP
jgi:hypothetical protein